MANHKRRLADEDGSEPTAPTPSRAHDSEEPDVEECGGMHPIEEVIDLTDFVNVYAESGDTPDTEQPQEPSHKADASLDGDPYAEFRQLLKGLIVRNGGFRATARIAGVTHPTLKKLTETAMPRWRVVHRLAQAHPDLAPALYRTAGCPPPPSARMAGPNAPVPLVGDLGVPLPHVYDPRGLINDPRGEPDLFGDPLGRDGVDLAAMARASLASEAFYVPDEFMAPLCQPGDILLIARSPEPQPGQVVLVERIMGPSIWVFRLREGRAWLGTADGSHATPMAETDVIRGVAVALYRPGPLMVGIR